MSLLTGPHSLSDTISSFSSAHNIPTILPMSNSLPPQPSCQPHSHHAPLRQMASPQGGQALSSTYPSNPIPTILLPASWVFTERPWSPAPRRVAHLSLHAADADQLVEDQQGPVDSIVSIHALLFGQGLIKPFLCFFKCVLKREDAVQGYNTGTHTHPHTHEVQRQSRGC